MTTSNLHGTPACSKVAAASSGHAVRFREAPCANVSASWARVAKGQTQIVMRISTRQWAVLNLGNIKKNEKEHSTQTKIRFQTVRSCWGRWQFGAHNCPAQGDFLSSGVSPHLEKKRNAVGCRVASWSTTREFHNPKHLQKLEPQNSAPAGPAGALSLFLSFFLPFPFLYSRCYDDRRQQDAVITSRNKCIYVYIYIFMCVYAFIYLFFIFLFIYLFNLFIDFLFKSIYLFVYLLSF